MKSIIFTVLLTAAAPAVFAQAAASAKAPAANTEVSAVCKDGTQYKGASLSGACRGHQGVDKTASAAGVSKQNQTAPKATATTASAPAATSPAVSSAATAGKVWANASSKVYHCSGDKYFGKTKQGEYMAESEAKAKGFHASHGKMCS